jgi:hypothetical protein
MMKIDVSYDALLQTLIEAIRDERDHGAAMMSLVSRLVEQACQQDWFEAHWRSDARLRLAQMACGHMPNGSRSAVPVLAVIAEAARWALKADEADSESQAILLAIMRLADVERSAGGMAKPRPVAKYVRKRKANGAGSVRRGRTAARPAKPAASAQATTGHKVRPTAAKAASARKAKRAKPVSRRHTPAQPAKPAASAQATTGHKARPTAAKAASARKAKRAKPMRRSHAPAQLARPAASRPAMTVAKAKPAAKAAPARKAKRAKPMNRSHTPAQLAKRPASPQAMTIAKGKPAAKTAPARKAKRVKPVSRSHTPVQPAKPAASPQVTAVAKAQPAAAKSAPARKPNGAAQASTKVGAPAIAT